MRNISDALKFRKKIKITTLAAAFLLLLCFFAIFMAKNPSATKAAVTIDSANQKVTIVGVSGCRIDANTLSGCSSGLSGNQNILDWDVVIDSSTVTVSNENHFKSLTIQNNGILTHDPVLISDINTNGNPLNVVSADYLSASALNKKVDLTIDGSLTLQTGGQINADGKGYPGTQNPANNNCAENGYGPGGGNCQYGNKHPSGGDGGGFGGSGGSGFINGSSSASPNNFYPASFSDFDDSIFYFGSGGGGAYSAKTSNTASSRGGQGGGRIHISAGAIVVSDTSKISANGSNSPDGVVPSAGDPTNVRAEGGAGAGGAIWIETSSFNFNNSNKTQLSISAGSSASGHVGGVGSFNSIGISQSSIYNLSVAGGGATGAGSGGGGRIAIDYNQSSVLINKILLPVQRNSTGNLCAWNYSGGNWTPDNSGNPNCTFNPYALQKGDIIEVGLNVTGLQPNTLTNITDEYLHLPNASPAVSCVSISNISPTGANTSGTNNGNSAIVWSGVSSDSSGKLIASYQCQITSQ